MINTNQLTTVNEKKSAYLNPSRRCLTSDELDGNGIRLDLLENIELDQESDKVMFEWSYTVMF